MQTFTLNLLLNWFSNLHGHSRMHCEPTNPTLFSFILAAVLVRSLLRALRILSVAVGLPFYCMSAVTAGFVIVFRSLNIKNTKKEDSDFE
jgi:hypothetical protein